MCTMLAPFEFLTWWSWCGCDGEAAFGSCQSLEVAPLPAPWMQGTWGKGLPMPAYGSAGGLLELPSPFCPVSSYSRTVKRGSLKPAPLSVGVTVFTGLWLDPSPSENCRILKLSS